MKDISGLLTGLKGGDPRLIAKAITVVENEVEGYVSLLKQLEIKETPVVGFTGPPGAGKSTLVNALITQLTEEYDKKIAVVTVDPTSPFNFGALLGDRIRLNRHFSNPNVYIRSLATRGALGGLSNKIIEVVDVLKASGFDMILVETVGVGQSEVEIAGLADTTVVVMVPESGDEIQTMKAGVMETADIFVVNKSDHQDAALFVKNLINLVKGKSLDGWEIPVIKTVATRGEGINDLYHKIVAHTSAPKHKERRTLLLAGKAYSLIQAARMADVKKDELVKGIDEQLKKGEFNLYAFIEAWL